MTMIPYPTIDDAHARSAELWDASKRGGWQPGNVTTHLYGTRHRTGDPEQDEGLPDGDAFMVVSAADDRLDGLVLAEMLTAAEYEALVGLYDAWSGAGVAYAADDLRQHIGQVWCCVIGHTSQSDWAPGIAVNMWTLTAPAGVIPAWVQPNGGHDAYALDALVTHGGRLWKSENAANVWEPGSEGAETLWLDLGEV